MLLMVVLMSPWALQMGGGLKDYLIFASLASIFVEAVGAGCIVAVISLPNWLCAYKILKGSADIIVVDDNESTQSDFVELANA